MGDTNRTESIVGGRDMASDFAIFKMMSAQVGNARVSCIHPDTVRERIWLRMPWRRKNTGEIYYKFTLYSNYLVAHALGGWGKLGR